MTLKEALKEKGFTIYSFAKKNTLSYITIWRLNAGICQPAVGTLEILYQYGIVKDLSKKKGKEYLIEK